MRPSKSITPIHLTSGWESVVAGVPQFSYHIGTEPDKVTMTSIGLMRISIHCFPSSLRDIPYVFPHWNTHVRESMIYTWPFQSLATSKCRLLTHWDWVVPGQPVVGNLLRVWRQTVQADSNRRGLRDFWQRDHGRGSDTVLNERRAQANAGTLRYPTCSLHTTRVFRIGSGHTSLLKTQYPTCDGLPNTKYG